MLTRLLVLAVVLSRNIVSATLFPEDSLVKTIGRDEFKSAMKEKMSFAVAFVSPNCGRCELLAPEYIKAALGLYPFMPMYAVDCEAPGNTRLCSDLKVSKLPTVKLFPRGEYMEPVDFKFDGPQASASELYYFAQRGIPDKIRIIRYIEDIGQINDRDIVKKHRALLMKRTNKLPLLWSVLANKYADDIEFFSHRDWRGKSSVKLGFEAGEEGESKVLIYPAGEQSPVQYKGLLKLDSLSVFFDSLLDGIASIDALNAKAVAEEFVPDPKEVEIKEQQEMEMLKLAHGGFADLIDFEAAIRDGSAKNFHGKQGYPGMMGGGPQASVPGVPEKKKLENQVLPKSNETRMPMTDEAGQIMMDVPSSVTTGTPTMSRESIITPTSQGVGVSHVIQEETISRETVFLPTLPVETFDGGNENRARDEL